MNYDLSGLSTDSFERLTQSLATKIIAPGVNIFGAGPDGGREATYEGKMAFPSTEEPWDGYLVVQAKFLERERDAKFDGDWAVKQLRSELAKYADEKKGRRTPEYYVFATNVVLTPVKDSGSKDRLAAVFEEFKSSVPIRGFRIWDYDQFQGFLDDHEAIRHAYSAWITPGDVLSSAFKRLRDTQPSFEDVMPNFLAKELLADQYARLEQAGQTVDERIPLAPVFVDLPVSTERLNEPSKIDTDKQPSKFAEQMINVARDRLDLSAMRAQRASETSTEGVTDAQAGRYVLVGGPGQGKTTIGQFICQLFRAALLKDRPEHTLSAETRNALKGITDACKPQGIEVPKARRFPIRIVLSDFAGALRKSEGEGACSLLAYLVQRIGRRTDRSVVADDLRKWLGSYPWLVVLDGLDEVPASSNRDQMLQAIEDFWIDAAQCDADLLVIATTRPQGYQDDFSPKYYRHMNLTPLTTAQALEYAERLAKAKFGDEDQRERILAQLQTASTHEAIARLMRTPLQITIMHTLVEHGGAPPRDRWQLFHDYYETIYRREKQRAIPASEVLQTHKADIDAIHERAALLLQVSAELSGTTENKLTAEQFGRIVDDRLEEEEFDEAERQKLKGLLIDAAGHRLVFLSGIEEGRVGFEIASLREYMAGQALFEGGDKPVAQRLRIIAPIAAWRNVFLFAAGRCFCTAQHLRDTIHTICVELNQELAGPVGRATRVGSLLAIDLLDDGLHQRSPKYAKLLARVALDVTELPPAETHLWLGTQCHSVVETVFRGHLVSQTPVAVDGAHIGAWATLIPLGDRCEWAHDVMENGWPSSLPDQTRLFESLPTSTAEQLPKRRLGEVACQAGLKWLLRFTQRPSRLRNAARPRGMRVDLLDGGFRLGWMSLRSHPPRGLLGLLVGDPTHGSWKALEQVSRFADSPSNDALAECLELTASLGALSDLKSAAAFLPWPIAACILACENPDELMSLKVRAESGALGGAVAWHAAERRWRKQRIREADLCSMTDDRWPFDSAIAETGFPIILPLISATLSRAENIGNRLLGVWERLESKARSSVGRWIGFAFSVAVRESNRIDTPAPAILESAISEYRGDQIIRLQLAYSALREWGSNSETWSLIDTIGRRCIPGTAGEACEELAEIACAVDEHQNRPGLFCIIAAEIRAGAVIPLEKLSLDPGSMESARFRHAAVVIRLAQGMSSDDEATRLAKVTTQNLAEIPRSVTDVTDTIQNQQLFGPRVDCLLLALLDFLPNNAIAERGAVVRTLADSQRRRRSELGQPERWRELGFRSNLVPLLKSFGLDVATMT